MPLSILHGLSLKQRYWKLKYKEYNILSHMFHTKHRLLVQMTQMGTSKESFPLFYKAKGYTLALAKEK